VLFSVFKRPHFYQYGAKKIEVRKKVDHFILVVAIVVVVVIVEAFPFLVKVMVSAITKTMTMTNETNNAITTGLNHFDWKMETLFSLLFCIKNIEKKVRFYRLYHYKYKFELMKKVYIIYTCNYCTVLTSYLY